MPLSVADQITFCFDGGWLAFIVRIRIIQEYLPILQKYISGSQSRQETGIYQTADEVAEVVMKVMGSEKPPVRTRTSQWSEDFSNLKTGLDPDGLKQQSRVAEQFLE